jgi:hypothetical protein
MSDLTVAFNDANEQLLTELSKTGCKTFTNINYSKRYSETVYTIKGFDSFISSPIEQQYMHQFSMHGEDICAGTIDECREVVSNFIAAHPQYDTIKIITLPVTHFDYTCAS